MVDAPPKSGEENSCGSLSESGSQDVDGVGDLSDLCLEEHFSPAEQVKMAWSEVKLTKNKVVGQGSTAAAALSVGLELASGLFEHMLYMYLLNGWPRRIAFCLLEPR